jgi:HNH endonuclease
VEVTTAKATRIDAASANEAHTVSANAGRMDPARAQASSCSIAGVPASAARRSHSHAPGGRAIEPIAAARYKVQFTAGAELKAKLELARDLMRHSVPDGDLATIVDQALDRLITEVMKRQFGARRAKISAREAACFRNDERASVSSETRPPCAPKTSPKASTIVHPARPGAVMAAAVPRAVRRAVVERDGLRCSWVGADGNRCDERAGLEYDHRHPRGKGGSSELDNMRLLCRAHNRHAAELEYGRPHMERAIVRGCHRRRAPPPDASARGG